MRIIRSLNDNWVIQSSSIIEETGKRISNPEYSPINWYPTQIPSTVVGALVENKVLKDPYQDTNLMYMEGFKLQVDTQNFESHEKPEYSPFRISWWFRKQFDVDLDPEKQYWLDIQGINYKANIWLNGTKIKSKDEIQGSYRQFLINISEYTKNKNVIALEVFSPGPTDLGISFVDWSPLPPDDNMGIWRPINLISTGRFKISNPKVTTSFKSNGLDEVSLTVSLDIINPTKSNQQIIVEGKIGEISIQQEITINSEETQIISFESKEFPQLIISQPRLWWPYELGDSELYTLDLAIKSGSVIEDTYSLEFGIRKLESYINVYGSRVFSINNEEILIKGAAWTPDMLLKHFKEGDEVAIDYIKNLNMNTIRLEGKLATDYFWRLCNKEGILVLAGWVCCSHWEKWDQWNDHHIEVAMKSLESQILRLRNHPSLICWLYGSDFPPPPKIECSYLDLLKNLYPELPILSSASATESEITGKTGVKMTGPYTYVPPIYWYMPGRSGEAAGFNTETGSDVCIPPLESLGKMFDLSKPDLIGTEVWNFHAGLGSFKDTSIIEEIVTRRFGGFSNVEEFSMYSQIVGYEAWRSMYEAHIRNFPRATGVIGWMLNSPWPSLIWQLYDFYYHTNGAFFGSKKACEPVHIFYAYDDHSIWISNTTSILVENLTAKVQILDVNGEIHYENVSTNLQIKSNSKFKVQSIPKMDINSIYFIKLTIKREEIISSNFYWMSSNPDILEPEDGWPNTKMVESADFSNLKSLPPATLSLDYEFIDNNSVPDKKLLPNRNEQDFQYVSIIIKNTSDVIAFFVRVDLKNDGKEIITPVYWNDNCISIVPGEKRTLIATIPISKIDGVIHIDVKGINLYSDNT